VHGGIHPDASVQLSNKIQALGGPNAELGDLKLEFERTTDPAPNFVSVAKTN
jgi:hypothetical protein